MSTTSHRNYYNQCYPIQCTYSYIGKNDFKTVITTVIGLIGGLSTILKFVIPQIIKIYLKFRKNRVESHLHTNLNE
jgi:hypothetical protein